MRTVASLPRLPTSLLCLALPLALPAQTPCQTQAPHRLQLLAWICRPLVKGGQTELIVHYDGNLVGYVETGSLDIRDHIDTALRRTLPAFGRMPRRRTRRAPQHGKATAPTRKCRVGCATSAELSVLTAGGNSAQAIFVAPDHREDDVRAQLARPAFSRVADLRVRFLPYGELERHREPMAKFGQGMRPIEALAKVLK